MPAPAERRERLAVLLAEGQEVKAAAATIGISERTAHIWRREPGFQARIRELQKERRERAAAVLRRMDSLALRGLQDALGSHNGAVKLGAVRTWLEFSYRVAETADLEERLAALEARLEEVLSAQQTHSAAVPPGAG